MPPVIDTKAKGATRRKYQVKVIFSNPIMATPAAEPMMIMLPPVAVQSASNSQKTWSVGTCVKGYIAWAAATSGMLSINAEIQPNAIATLR